MYPSHMWYVKNYNWLLKKLLEQNLLGITSLQDDMEAYV